ncbi:hepatic lectin-like isoform X2 [Hyla sarda]|uniref:hepatic lectin-like isoform X2 n=1 Tax=Hyla sarda TaxID=327740 RepID=UPI0024C28E45|nr:hepatic lectin-like isoform X2 [Hyla sarda]
MKAPRKRYYGEMWSYFKERPVIITYALLALSFILVMVLFVTVHSNNFKPDKKVMASKDDILGVNITVNSLAEKMKEIEHTAKKMGTCDSGWYFFDRKCYFFSNTKSNWNRARSLCVQKNADLAVINNENEQRFISSITGSMPYWIGLTDNESEGNWTWVDGTDYKKSYKSWSPDEPNSSGGEEDCAQVLKLGKWNDKSCHDTNTYAICEKKL